MSRCRPCESAPATGAAAEGTGCITVTGAGTDASPFEITLAAGCLPLIACTSVTRPAGPAEGQEIFETDTGRTRIWNGSIWKLLNPITTGVDQHAGGNGVAFGPATPGYPGAVTVASLTITEPFGSGDPFAALVSGRVLASGTAADAWDIFLDLDGGASRASARALLVAPSYIFSKHVGPSFVSSTDGSDINVSILMGGLGGNTSVITTVAGESYTNLRAQVFAL